jgi:hypothetical protein
MDDYNLGPNGGLLFCMEGLLTNLEFLEDGIQLLMEEHGEDLYLVFDCPGQVRVTSSTF